MLRIRAAVRVERERMPPWFLPMAGPMQARRYYHTLVPWQEFAQVRVVAFQPMVLTTFLTPLLWLTAFTAVVL